MNKIMKERLILDYAKPSLSELYGNFCIDSEQIDRPDAAIVICSSKKRVGIEITSVDKRYVQQYFNDQNFGRKGRVEQAEKMASTGEYSGQPEKTLSIPFPYDYIYEGIKYKSEKYNEYFDLIEYEEVILIAFSDYMTVRNIHFFESYHKPWTWNLLSEKNYPFSKVIFVCTQYGESSLIFNKETLVPTKPEVDPKKELGLTRIVGPYLPAGKKINFLDIFNKEPRIKPPRKKSKKNQKNLEQKKSRKKNRGK